MCDMVYSYMSISSKILCPSCVLLRHSCVLLFMFMRHFTATHCNTLQHTATATHCNTLCCYSCSCVFLRIHMCDITSFVCVVIHVHASFYVFFFGWVLQHCTGFARLVWGRLRVHWAFIYSNWFVRVVIHVHASFYCNTLPLQHTATHCHCNTLQHTVLLFMFMRHFTHSYVWYGVFIYDFF